MRPVQKVYALTRLLEMKSRTRVACGLTAGFFDGLGALARMVEVAGELQ